MLLFITAALVMVSLQSNRIVSKIGAKNFLKVSYNNCIQQVLIFIYWEWAHVTVSMRKSEDSLRSQCSLSTMGVPGVKLRWSNLAASTFVR